MIKFFQAILLCIIIFLALFINSYPNYYAFINTPAGYEFSGQASWFDPWDINVYVSAIKWGQNHGLLLENVYTTTKHSPVLMYPLYTLTGFLFPAVSPFLLFHLSATFFGLILLLVIFKLSQVFLKSRTYQLIAVFLISLGGGIGWIFFPGFQSSDLFMTGFTFSSQFQRPHEALGIIFYLLSLVIFYQSIKEKSSRLVILSSVFLILLMFFYPFYLLSFAAIGGLYSFVIYFRDGKKYPFIFLLLNFIPAFIILLIYFSHLQSSQGFSGVLSQNLNRQNILQIICGYGILSIIIIYQFFRKSRKEEKEDLLFLNIWLFISIMLSFLPLGFSRFYLRTLFFPVIIISLIIIKQFSKKTLFLIILSTIIPLSSFYIAYKRMDEVGKNNHWFYLSTEEKEAINFLNKNSFNGLGVLAGYTLGNYIPANTNNRVYFGHLIQTPNSEEKIINLTKFYGNIFTDSEAQKFLESNNIQYILFGPDEKAITKNYTGNPILKYKSLIPIFEAGDIVVLKYNF